MPRKPLPVRTREQNSEAGKAKFDVNLASTVLASAIVMGDTKAAAAFEVDVKTIRAWRARMSSDAEFSGIFHEKARYAREHWADQLIPGIQAHIAAGMEVAQSGIKDPLMFAESNNALRILLDAQFSLEILYARIRQYGGDGSQASGPGPTRTNLLGSGE